MVSIDKVMCEACGFHAFDLEEYRSLLMVSEQKALFTLRCPQCGATVVALCPVPDELRPAIRRGAAEVDAGMGRER